MFMSIYVHILAVKVMLIKGVPLEIGHADS